MEDVLPVELWTQILVRLPVRSLITLKCVSKSFLSLIQNPNFTSLHFSLLNSESKDSDLLLLERCGSFIVCRGNSSSKKPEFVISVDKGDDVVDYVNGLLWLHRFDSPIKYMLLCNPSIRKCLLIPPSPASPMGKTDVGFGYDPISDDYKAVVIVHGGTYGFCKPLLARKMVEVYSLKTGSWRRIGVDLVPRDWLLGTSLYANGAVHWVASKLMRDRHHYRVISFDLGSEVFSFRELPNVSKLGHGGLKLLSSIHRSLAVLNISYCHICIWVLGESGWTEKYMESSSLYNHLFKGGRVAERITKTIFCEESGELLFAEKKGGLVSYNLRTKKYGNAHHSVTYVARYVENLLWNELLPPSQSIARSQVR